MFFSSLKCFFSLFFPLFLECSKTECFCPADVRQVLPRVVRNGRRQPGLLWPDGRRLLIWRSPQCCADPGHLPAGARVSGKMERSLTTQLISTPVLTKNLLFLLNIQYIVAKRFLEYEPFVSITMLVTQNTHLVSIPLQTGIFPKAFKSCHLVQQRRCRSTEKFSPYQICHSSAKS